MPPNKKRPYGLFFGLMTLVKGWASKGLIIHTALPSTMDQEQRKIVDTRKGQLVLQKGPDRLFPDTGEGAKFFHRNKGMRWFTICLADQCQQFTACTFAAASDVGDVFYVDGDAGGEGNHIFLI